MWKNYEVNMTIAGKFAASIPKTEEEIKKMLEHRMPSKPPENAVPINELAKEVAEEVGTEPEIGWATFKRNNEGLYYEGRCIRGHIKDCAQQVSSIFPAIKAFKAKIANKVYVMDDVIPIRSASNKKTVGTLVSLLPQKIEPDGYVQRFIQVMTRQGPRSTYKYIDYVENIVLNFGLSILDDGFVTDEILSAILTYGSIHGLGQERSQGWGRYVYAFASIVS